MHSAAWRAWRSIVGTENSATKATFPGCFRSACRNNTIDLPRLVRVSVGRCRGSPDSVADPRRSDRKSPREPGRGLRYPHKVTAASGRCAGCQTASAKPTEGGGGADVSGRPVHDKGCNPLSFGPIIWGCHSVEGLSAGWRGKTRCDSMLGWRVATETPIPGHRREGPLAPRERWFPERQAGRVAGIVSGCCVWMAGVGRRPLARWSRCRFGVEPDRTARGATREGHWRRFDGLALPGLAPPAPWDRGSREQRPVAGHGTLF